MSVAQLGFAVNSSQLVGATKALHDLTAAAKPAAQAAAEIGKASTTAATGAAHLSSSAEKAATGGAKALTTQTGLARHELINLSRQLQDVGVSLVSGQSPFTVLAQQGAQIADIFGSSRTGTVGGAIRQIVGGIASVITPMRLLAVGVAATGIAAYASFTSWKNYALQIDDVARASGTATAELAKLQSAAAVKGISNEEFAKGMQSFASSVYDAQHGMGDLADVFRANNTHAKTFDDHLEKAADLIKRASSDQQRLQLLQQMGLPPTMEWVRLLSQGAEGLRAAKDAMTEIAANQEIIRKAREFDEAWNRIKENFLTGWRNATLDVAGFFQNLGNVATKALMSVPGIGGFVPTNILRSSMLDAQNGFAVKNKLTANSSVDEFYSALGAGAPGNTKAASGVRDPNTVKHDLQLEQQRLALLGQTTTAEEAALAVQLQANQARLNGVAVDQKRVDVLKQLAREQSIGVTQIKAMTDSYTIETATIGMSVGAATQYAAAQNAINQHLRAHRFLSAESLAAINAQAAALGDAATKADLMHAAYSGLVRGPLQTLTSQIANGAKFFDALKAAGLSALNSIASKLADMAAQGLWQAAMGGASGGTGGGLIGGIVNLFKNANGNVFPANDNGISRYSSQIVDRPTVFPFAKGIGLMGEAGPEAIMPLTRGPNGKLGVAATGGANSNTPQDINIKVDVTGARGSQEISDAVNEGVGRALNAYRGSIAQVNDVAAASKRANTRRLGR